MLVVSHRDSGVACVNVGVPHTTIFLIGMASHRTGDVLAKIHYHHLSVTNSYEALQCMIMSELTFCFRRDHQGSRMHQDQPLWHGRLHWMFDLPPPHLAALLAIPGPSLRENICQDAPDSKLVWVATIHFSLAYNSWVVSHSLAS